MKQIFMLGDGAWGTAVATILANNGYEVLLWCYQEEVAHSITKTRINERYLPGIVLPEQIIPVTDFSAVSDVDWIFEAIPVQYLRSVLQEVKPFITKSPTWVALSKGIEQESLSLPGDIVKDVLGSGVQTVVLSGPSFAYDLAHHAVTAMVAASGQKKLSQELSAIMSNDYGKIFISDDPIGVQVGGAFKNVISLALGMLSGAQQADNTKAFLFTQGLHEIALIAQALGGQEATIYGLAGVGDLVLTAISTQSRNFQVGKYIGSGESLAAVLEKTGYTPEGANTVKSVYRLMQQYQLNLPLCRAVYHIIFEQKTVADLLKVLVDLPQK